MISDTAGEIKKRIYSSVESMGGIEDEELYKLIDEVMLEKQYRSGSVWEKLELRRDIFNSIKRLDVIQDIIDDDSVTEIMINGYRNIFIEREGKIERYHKTFASKEKLLDVVQRIAARSNKIVNESTPIIDTRLSDGSRVNIVMNPIAIDGPAVTIRKFYDNPLTMDRLIALGAITHEAAEYLKELVAARYNIFISGGTGSGKTTIVNLLTRFYPVDSGEITIDGQSIYDIPKDKLRRSIAIVLQDTVLFKDTIEENIRYGRENATLDEIKAAAKFANADEFIERLSEGYDTVLAEGGSNLSQGQRQLLSIARAVLADPKILILDEATSSVDTRTEMHIQSAMVALMKNRTSLIIAHRLSTIRDADKIVVIDGGRVAEQGSHEELIAAKGCYYRLYQTQFSGVKT